MLAIYRQGEKVVEVPTPAPYPAPSALDQSEALGELGIDILDDLADLGANMMKIGTGAKWVGIGVLALAGGVLLFKLTEFIFGE